MRHLSVLVSVAALGGLAALVLASPGEVKRPLPATKAAKRKTVSFAEEILPILSDKRFACHGPDEKARKANLRVDIPDPSNRKIVSPGASAKSSIYQRVASKVPSLQMPPPDFPKHLSPEQVELIRKWIDEGAEWETHWSFRPVKRSAVPAVRLKNWARNPIDNFVLARLEEHGLKPSRAADRRTLIRRVSLDLTGLAPTPAEVEAFVNDKSPKAYEAVVDRLLASLHYGERMGLMWLDLARYADTHGYHIDPGRFMWRWRDWVIEAFNKNMPFDKFTVEQIAGDLLPNATLSQKIATGFNRNHPINFEGGAIPEEYQTNYVIDRLDTTATVWLGLSLKCAQCHNHKYEPFTSKDYYRFFAFFNTIPENGLDGTRGNAAPFIKAPTPDQEVKLKEADVRLADINQAIKRRTDEAGQALATWTAKMAANPSGMAATTEGLAGYYPFDRDAAAAYEDDVTHQAARVPEKPVTTSPGKIGNAANLAEAAYLESAEQGKFDRDQKFSYGAWVKPASNGHMAALSRMDNSLRGWDLYLGDGRIYVHMIHQWEGNAIRVNTKLLLQPNQWAHVMVTFDGSSKAKGLKVYVNGQPVELEITHDTLTGTIQTDASMKIGRRTGNARFQGQIDEVRLYSRMLLPIEVSAMVTGDNVRPVLAVAPDKRSDDQKRQLTTYFLETSDETYRKLSADRMEAKQQRDAIDAAIPTTMVMQEMDTPRETHMLIRGQYNQKGDKVACGTPELLPAMSPSAPRNRLGLAEWLVSNSNPLTARVTVNRFWQLAFGAGIVKTSENFGLQGEHPSNPELLDWLASDFVRSGWDVKGLMKQIVMSATYCQSSSATPAQLKADPENRMLSRGPRFRMPAELVRDLALSTSGLLVPTIGGPSVKIYQPAGLWEEISFRSQDFSEQNFQQDHGEKLWRRSLYTFWKRTCPPPTLQTFDAPEREFCIVKRNPTNTPLQALALMNDPCFVEASRKLAERLMKEASTPTERIKLGYLLAVSRPPTAKEAKVFIDLFTSELKTFKADPKAAEKLLTVGEAPRDMKLDPSELAAWTSVANVLLNMDEAITKG